MQFFHHFFALFLYHDSLRFPGPQLGQGARKSLIINNRHSLHREMTALTFILEIIYRSRCYFVVNHCAKVLSFIDTIAVLMNNHISRTFPG